MKNEVTGLNELLSRLQKEGVEKAKEAAGVILKDAQTQANQIIKEAKSKAEEQLSQSSHQIKVKEETSQKRLQLAARDTVIKLNEKLREQFEVFLSDQCKEALKPEIIKDLIANIATSAFPKANFVLSLPQDTDEEIIQKLAGGFAKEIQEKMTIQREKGLEVGFYLSSQGEEKYFEFTDKNIASEITQLLSKPLQKLLNPLQWEEETK